MTLTANSNVFASVSEATFNKIVANIALQRPSMFNYGTASFVAAPRLMCRPIFVAPQLPDSQPRVTLESPIPIPGTAGAWGMEFCVQLTKLQVDFHPGELIELPPQLEPPLAEQTLALQVEVCGAIACPSPETLALLGLQEAERYPPLDPGRLLRDRDEREEPKARPREAVPIDAKLIHCFCLDVFALASLRHDITANRPVLAAKLKGLEIVDLSPDGLEQSLECLMTATIVLGVLPRLRVALDAIILSLGEFGDLEISLAPTSAAIPFNPGIAKDELSVFVNVQLN